MLFHSFKLATWALQATLSQNKVFRSDLNYIKEMQINWENFVTVRDKNIHVEIRVFIMTCLFDLFLTVFWI